VTLINTGNPDTKHGDLVLFVKAIAPDPGGVEAYSDSVAQAWAELGFRVTVITQFNGPVGTEMRGPVTVINVGPGSQLAVFWRMLRASAKLKKEITASLIHSTTWRVAIPALLVFRNTPIAVTVHGREVTEMTGITKWLMRRVFASIDAALVISKSTLDQCMPMLPDLRHLSVISWNGLTYLDEARQHAKVWRGDSDRPLRLYSLCRLVPRKNIDGVLRALASLRSKGVENWEYKVAGNGADRASLEALTRELGLADKVRFLGRVGSDEIGPLYREADLFLHPQTAGPDGRDIEGFGLVIVDAMAFGIPVIAGIDGAPREYIRDGETAYLVDGNDIPAMATLLERLIENPGELRDVGQAGREWALQTLTWREHVERLWNAMGSSER
jgi:phosphatidylinositol alpha-1,6-mannosyltransferase